MESGVLEVVWVCAPRVGEEASPIDGGVEGVGCRIEGGLEGGFPGLEEFPASCITYEVEAGSFVSIRGKGSVKCGTDCTECCTELGREESKVYKVWMVSPGSVGSRGVVQESEEDEGCGGAILCTG